MSEKPPPSEATVPAVGDSPTCLQSTADVADVDALTISPAAAHAAAAVAIGQRLVSLFCFTSSYI